MREGMKDLLNIVDIGYDITVLTADNGQTGLDAMGQYTPDLIVSDIMMPQMDGLEFLRHVRKNSKWLHIPLIFLTARNAKRDIYEGQVQGAQLYLTKPFNSGELLELIKSQLDRTFQLQSTHQHNVDKLKKDLLQLLNHEFRTPLTYVTAYYEMLAFSVSQLQETQDFEEYLRGIQVGSLRLTNLVENLIQVIELRTGEIEEKYKQEATVIDGFETLVQEAIQANREQAIQHGVQILYDEAVTLPPIFGVRENLLTILHNLIDNAIKFTYHHKKDNVIIHAYTSDHELYLAVQDEGIGFPLHITNRLFELFFQYKRSVFEQQGAGVGLTIVKSLTELHNGRIEVESQKGVGSTFTLVLPIHNAQQSGHSVNQPAEDKPDKATVLIVEDEPHLLEGLQDILELSIVEYELTILTATNGRQGLQALAEYHPQLIISDIMMPEMDGMEFLQEVRQNPAWVQIPFIFLTAKGEGRDIHQGRRSGAEEYITKPYDTNELISLVLKQLDRHFQMQGILTQDFDILKRSLLNLVTPDFRMPLANVAHYSEKLAEGIDNIETDADLKASLQGIQASSVGLTQLVEDIIALAELETGEAATVYNLQAQPIYNVDFVIEEAIKQAESIIERFDVEIVAQPNANLPAIFGVSTILTESVQRLIEAGIRLQQEAQTINITTTSNTKDLVIHIDFAKSLTKEQVDHIQALFSTDKTAAFDASSYDPGLRIADGSIRLHNGRIEVASRSSSDLGMQFAMYIPLYQQS